MTTKGPRFPPHPNLPRLQFSDLFESRLTAELTGYNSWKTDQKPGTAINLHSLEVTLDAEMLEPGTNDPVEEGALVTLQARHARELAAWLIQAADMIDAYGRYEFDVS